MVVPWGFVLGSSGSEKGPRYRTQLLLVSAPPQGHCDSLKQEKKSQIKMSFLTEMGISLHRHGPWESPVHKRTCVTRRLRVPIIYLKKKLRVGNFFYVPQYCGSASPDPDFYLMRMRNRILIFIWCGWESGSDFSLDADPDPAFWVRTDPTKVVIIADPYQLDADPDPTYHFDADPDHDIYKYDTNTNKLFCSNRTVQWYTGTE